MTDSTLAALFERYGASYRWMAMLTVMMGTISTILTSTIINVALPEMMSYFSMPQGVAHWLSTGFLAAMTIAMLTTSWLMQRFGLRASIAFAMLAFCGASVLGGLSNAPGWLIGSRVVQGAAAGMLQPLAMFVLFRVFPKEQRGKAMGIYGIGVILAPALGPVLGGVIVDQLNWRYVFFVPLPISLTGFLLTMRYMPPRDLSQPLTRFDWLGFALLTLGIGASLDALTRLQHGIADAAVLLPEAILGVVSLFLFVWQQTFSPAPLLQLSLMRIKSFRNAALVALALGLALYGSTYLIPIFVQTAYHFTPTEAGLMMFPAGIVLGALFPFAGSAADRGKPHRLIIAGLATFGVATLLWLATNNGSSLVYLMVLVALGRVGLALLMPALSTGALLDVNDLHLGQASGMINFSRQFGAAFGTNLIAVILESGADSTGIETGSSLASSLSFYEAFGIMGLLSLIAVIPAWKMRALKAG